MTSRMTGREVIWVRHGESTWNRVGLMQGQTPWPRLTARGQEQAQRAADRVARLGARRILSSDLARALETARIIGARLGIAVSKTPLLRERCWGLYEGLPIAVGAHADSLLAPEDALPRGESREDVATRLRLLLPDLLHGGGRVIVVTHGDVLREAINLWAPCVAETQPLDNGCVLRATLPPTSDLTRQPRWSPPCRPEQAQGSHERRRGR